MTSTPDAGPSPLVEDPLRVTLQKCSECEQIASREAWQSAWWIERSRRIVAGHEPDDRYGLDEREVCPWCGFVHSDNDMASVEEFVGRAVALYEKGSQP